MFFPTIIRYPEDEDRDGLRNVGLLTAQPFYLADSPKELNHTRSPGKQQIPIKINHKILLEMILDFFEKFAVKCELQMKQ
jgi:hypothetical protein